MCLDIRHNEYLLCSRNWDSLYHDNIRSFWLVWIKFSNVTIVQREEKWRWREQLHAWLIWSHTGCPGCHGQRTASPVHWETRIITFVGDLKLKFNVHQFTGTRKVLVNLRTRRAHQKMESVHEDCTEQRSLCNSLFLEMSTGADHNRIRTLNRKEVL